MNTWIKKTIFSAKMIALVFMASISLNMANAAGPVISQPVHPEKEKLAPTVQPGGAGGSTDKFDGKALYKEAFENIRDMHILLADPAVREKWAKEWESKFDATDSFKTEEGTDAALLQLNYSLKQRFDYFFDQDATRVENQQVDSTTVGIGATLTLSKMQEIIKGLPKDAKREDVEKALLISAENRLEVNQPIEGGPAEKAGVLPGDVILEVDGVSLNGMSMKDAIAKIKGKAGTSVTLTVERKDPEDESLTIQETITIKRAVVVVPVVKFKDLGSGISYVSLADFMSRNAASEMWAAFKKAAKGKALIIDVRGNPGGSLDAVLTIVGMVLNEGPILVTEYRNGDKVIENEIILKPDMVLQMEPSQQDPKQKTASFLPRTKLVIPEEMPVIVLIDEGSASASEILSGALQHNHRALILGKSSHGKGVGQSVIDLKFGRRLHVTTFEFKPGRTANNWIGVVRDVEVDRSKDPKVDSQLDKAVELIKPMIEQVKQRVAERAALKKLHEEEFQKQLEEREKKAEEKKDEKKD